MTSSTAGSAPIFPGDSVEIFGLNSQAGKELNGSKGVATKFLSDVGRYEVRVGVEKRVTVRPENLRLVQKDAGSVAEGLGFGAADRKAECAAAASFREGDLVEVVNLDTVQARELNGKPGTVVQDYETPPDRVKVKVCLGEMMGKEQFRHATLKPANLKKVTYAGLTDEQRAAMPQLQNGGAAPRSPESSMQENILRSQLSRLSAQERHSGTDPFKRVPLAVEPGGSASERMAPGDVVEVSGLTSSAGQLLNGERGVIVTCIAADVRAEVRLSEGVKKLKYENLRKLDVRAGDCFMVEVVGLQSESGKALNGQRGIVSSCNPESGRLDVKFSKEKTVAVKPENLILLHPAKK